MSQALAVSTTGASYWAYTAFVLASRLKRVIKAGAIAEGDIPAGILGDAQRFFDLIIQLMDRQTEDRAASGNAYLIAHDALTTTGQIGDDESDEPTLRKFGQLLSTIATPHTLSEQEIETAGQLQALLMSIHARGTTDEYLRIVQQGDGFDL